MTHIPSMSSHPVHDNYPAVSPSLRALDSPYTKLPLPIDDEDAFMFYGMHDMEDEQVGLHPLLEYGYKVRFDLGLGTEHITAYPYPNYPFVSSPSTTSTTPTRRIPLRSLMESATYPPLPLMVIRSRFLPWPIVVRPLPGSAYVTVIDVFATISNELQRKVTKEELMYVHAPREQWLVMEASSSRITHSPPPSSPSSRPNEGLRGHELTQAVSNFDVVRRLDFFFGAREFMGLARMDGGWELNVKYF